VWVEKILLDTLPETNLEELSKREDSVGSLLRYLEELPGDEAQLLELADELSDLKRKIPAELFEGEGAVRIDDLERLRKTVAEDVRRILAGRLLYGGGSE
jgi:hypothetical protein